MGSGIVPADCLSLSESYLQDNSYCYRRRM